jgi:mRNA interferase MazF
MICDAFDLVVVPFPFIDVPVVKPRPALVLSIKAFNRANGHSLLGMITTGARSRWPSDYAIKDLDSAGLRTPCVLRLKVFTLENRLLARSLGRLSAADRKAVSHLLRSLLPS